LSFFLLADDDAGRPDSAIRQASPPSVAFVIAQSARFAKREKALRYC
jgi:hypothetical protein